MHYCRRRQQGTHYELHEVEPLNTKKSNAEGNGHPLEMKENLGKYLFKSAILDAFSSLPRHHSILISYVFKVLQQLQWKMRR